MLERLRAEGLKLTAQRRAIVEQFATDESHPTAQELFERLRGVFPKMSFATVYNTLDALAHAGLSSTLRFSNPSSANTEPSYAQASRGREANAARFDPNIEPHHHAVCDRCGSVSDIPARSLSADAPRVLNDGAPGFELRAVERIYRGLCQSCRGKKNTRKNKQNRV